MQDATQSVAESPGAASTTTSTTPATTAAARQALGAYGENVAARHLVERGFTILDRNWRNDDGEIDLVAREGDTLVVVEVKTRTSDACGTPQEAVGDAKLARLRGLADAWARDHRLNVPDMRVDLVAVLRPPRGAAIVDHVRGLA